MEPFDYLIIGTLNPGKVRELSKLLTMAGIPWKTALDFHEDIDACPEERGSTFAENARIKAEFYAWVFHRWVVAEDSGLEVDALDGLPGVYSARFAGKLASDRQNYMLLLEKLRGVPKEKRGAQFVCHMVVADNHGKIRLEVTDVCRGRITEEPRGEKGFGYDPVFEIPEYHRTFAELGPVVKNVISHRGRAARKLVPQLVRLLKKAD